MFRLLWPVIWLSVHTTSRNRLQCLPWNTFYLCLFTDFLLNINEFVYICVCCWVSFLMNELFRIICKVFQLRLITVSDNNKLKVEKEVGQFVLGPFWEQIGSVTGISAKHFRVNVLFSGNCSWLGHMEIKWAMHDKLFLSTQIVVETAIFLQQKWPTWAGTNCRLRSVITLGKLLICFLFVLEHTLSGLLFLASSIQPHATQYPYGICQERCHL